jgi:hypothetical protein
MPNFSKARVGDKCYHLMLGDCEIVCIGEDQIKVQSDSPLRTGWYYKNGNAFLPDETPTIYHSKPEISDPPPPKRMVKKTVWGNFYERFASGCFAAGNLYFTKEEAINMATSKVLGQFCVELEYEE